LGYYSKKENMVARLGSKMFYINENGEHLEPKYDIVSKYGEDLTLILDESKTAYQFFEEVTEVILPVKFHEVQGFSNGLAIIKFNEKYGYVNLNGNATKIKYDFAEPFDGVRAVVSIDSKKSIMNGNGIEIMPFKYDTLGKFSEGLAYVSLDYVPYGKTEGKDQKFGFIDENGKEVIPRIYDKVNSFKDGVAGVRMGDEIFNINKKGERVK